ncbi:hypothetical protein [Candidatus Manganitrophus noduliformans]|uniref:Uncharacterized protein n=1 Tax=Candidatus Manganitrophus noduliformans TaxID=2606439 RepID=A0A7X6DMJ5_9BACT|nr:hypothetical protein [Candidatus Manganitrophus noduliformans]NKE69987.1 hypothetical protein [Candidatus Manganitrophus noduliformans]
MSIREGINNVSTWDLLKGAGIGVINAVLLSAIMVPLFRAGVSPLPEPLGLAFAETLLNRPLPLPIGLLFHIAWVTLWSMVYVALFRDRLTFGNALLVALILWASVLFFFFPFVGWGFLGLKIGPMLIAASAVPHFLFALFLWALSKFSFGKPTEEERAARRRQAYA